VWAQLLVTTILATFPVLGNAQTVLHAPSSAQAVADTGTIATGAFNLRYRIEGAGTPTIVIGFPSYYAQVFSKNLRSHIRLVFVDHRGNSPSPGPVDTTEFALETLIDDIELVRQTLGLGRIAVIGHSGHSYMALEYAKKYPQNVSHVVMIGISPDLSAASAEAVERYWRDSVDPERKAALEENLERLPDEQLAQMPPDQAFIQAYIRNGPRIWYDPRFDSSPLWEGVEINMDMFNYVWGRVFRDIDITEGLEALDRPVFLALGRYDFIVAPPSSWDPVRPKFQDLTVRVFERSGHTPQYEQADLFDEELLRWLRQHD
jgi:proline iminopeptidase